MTGLIEDGVEVNLGGSEIITCNVQYYGTNGIGFPALSHKPVQRIVTVKKV